jgi:hypothetical protein
MLKLDKFFKKFVRSQLAEISTSVAKITPSNSTVNSPSSSNCPISVPNPVSTVEKYLTFIGYVSWLTCGPTGCALK